MVLQRCCSELRKEKGWKNEGRVAVYTWQRLYVVTCGFCLQITVISPSNAWNGRGFCILLFVCVIPVSWESWLGTSELTWAPAKKLKCTNSPSRTNTLRLFLPVLLMPYAEHGTICRSSEHLIPRDLAGNKHSQHSQKLNLGEDSSFAVSPSFQLGLLHPVGDCSVTGRAS